VNFTKVIFENNLDKWFIMPISDMNNSPKEAFFKEIRNIDKNVVSQFAKDVLEIRKIYNGVAAGKTVELMFSCLIRKYTSFFANRLELRNSNESADIVVSEKERFLRNLNKIIKKNNSLPENVLFMSLKNYQKNECQISTGKFRGGGFYREHCESVLGDKVKTESEDLIKKVVGKIKSDLFRSQKTTLSLNAFDDLFVISNMEFASDDIDKIVLEKLRKYKNYRFYSDKCDKYVFEIKYGKNQANPYQRGIWTKNIGFFDTIKSVPYAEDECFNIKKMMEEQVSNYE
jgi:hypothetical protein